MTFLVLIGVVLSLWIIAGLAMGLVVGPKLRYIRKTQTRKVQK